MIDVDDINWEDYSIRLRPTQKGAIEPSSLMMSVQ